MKIYYMFFTMALLTSILLIPAGIAEEINPHMSANLLNSGKIPINPTVTRTFFNLSMGEIKTGLTKKNQDIILDFSTPAAPKGPHNKLLEDTKSCFEKCKKDSYYKSSFPVQSKCVLDCSMNDEYQDYSCKECKGMCEGLRVDVKPVCIQNCEDYNIQCKDPTNDCNACLAQCEKNNNAGNCFQKCEQSLCGDKTCFQCKSRFPDLFNKSKKSNWDKYCAEVFTDCKPVSENCQKCLSTCKDIHETDKQENCVMNCGNTKDCKLKNSESCKICKDNCQGLLPSVKSSCLLNCGVDHLNCEPTDPSKCDECWKNCKLNPNKKIQASCINECQSMEICKDSNCNDCQDRAAGLSPSVYSYWIEKCRLIYSDCSSPTPAQCDKCWSDCTTTYAKNTDLNGLSVCIDNCQKTDSCINSTCGQCMLRSNNARAYGGAPLDWAISMNNKCVSSYSDCFYSQSNCYNCTTKNCKTNLDCMNLKCPDCVTGWNENKCLNCEDFCSKQADPYFNCTQQCDVKNNNKNFKCPQKSCDQCMDACSLKTDPEQRSICDTLCILNKKNNCNFDCHDCWEECSHINGPDSETCRMTCLTTNDFCGKQTCSDCLNLVKEYIISNNDPGKIDSWHNKCANIYHNCPKPASAQVSLSLNNTINEFTSDTQITVLIKLPMTEWAVKTSSFGTFFPGPTILTPTMNIGRFSAGTGDSITRTGDSFTGTGRVVSGGLPPQDTGNRLSVTGSGNTLSGRPLFFGNTSNVNITTNATVKINSSNI